jgi:hypothetical protein
MNVAHDHHLKILAEVFEHLKHLTQSKGQEYTGQQGVNNVHANFDRLATKLNLIPEKVLWVYLTKHIDSIETWINGIGMPTTRKLSEPMEGRIDDAILYLVLLRGMVWRRERIEPARNGAGQESLQEMSQRMMPGGYPDPG